MRRTSVFPGGITLGSGITVSGAWSGTKLTTITSSGHTMTINGTSQITFTGINVVGNVAFSGGGRAGATLAFATGTPPNKIEFDGYSSTGSQVGGTLTFPIDCTVTPSVEVTDGGGLLLNVVTPPATTVNNVTYFIDGISLTTTSTPPYQVNYVTSTPPGVHTVSAAVNMVGGSASGQSTWVMTHILDAGYSHSCALFNNVGYCWGDNSYGQLGNAAFTNSGGIYSATPLVVDGLTLGSHVSAITTGGQHSCAIVNGVAKCWGGNGYGQLGTNNGLTMSPAPFNVQGLPAGNVTWIDAGFYHTCAVVNGASYCWGSNAYGALGKASLTVGSNYNVAQAVDTLTNNVKLISSGINFNCAIRTSSGNQQVSCWGANGYGQLGLGDTIDRSTPVYAPNWGTPDMISSGGFDSCSLKLSTGAINCVGFQNPSGITLIAGVSAKSISVGWFHACSVTASNGFSNGMKCWGWTNQFGQIGNGTTSQQPVAPVTVVNMNTSDVALGSASLGFHTCSFKLPHYHCWGSNTSGQIGVNPYDANPHPTPIQVPTL